MSNVKDLPFEQIRNWVKAETEKGRPMREIVAELATRQDVTVLSVKDSPEKRHQQIVDAIAKTTSS
jgi:hypothetical protein